MRLSAVVETSMRVAESSGRLQKVALLADLLAQSPPEEIETVITFLSGTPRQGRIGVGWAAIVEAREAPPASEASLAVAEVDDTFGRIASLSGPGSSRARAEALRSLFGRATDAEQDFLARLLFGELRQGALEGVLVEAVARASKIPAAAVRRAAMLAGALAPVARAALVEGESALQALVIKPFTPVQPMLADSAADVDAALGDLGEASLEYKLDGARIQVHKAGDDVRVYSRNLRDVSVAVPEVVEAARALTARGDRPRRRSDRPARRRDAASLPDHDAALWPEARCRDPSPHAASAAVLLRLPVLRGRSVDRSSRSDGASICSHAKRQAACWCRASSRRTPCEAATFMERALAAGHEGVMAKGLDGLYAAGRRGAPG